jgi:hypothetical protein
MPSRLKNFSLYFRRKADIIPMKKREDNPFFIYPLSDINKGVDEQCLIP